MIDPQNQDPNLTGPRAYETDEPSVQHPVMLGQTVLGMVDLYPRVTGEHAFSLALGRLRGHLNDIAGDSRGSDPSLYVSEDDLRFFNELKDVADHRMNSPWKGATPITHKETTPRWLKGPRRSDGVVRDSKGKPVVGYRVGYLNVSQFESPVFFCSDGTLRMLIKHADTKTRGLRGTYDGKYFNGYCRLPDPKYLYPVRTRGTKSGVSYYHGQTNTLKTELKKLSGFNFE